MDRNGQNVRPTRGWGQRSAAALVALVLLLGACGSDSETGSEIETQPGLQSEVEASTPSDFNEPTTSQGPTASTPPEGDAIPTVGAESCTILTDRHLLDAMEIGCDEPHDHVLYAAGSIEVSSTSTAAEITEATQVFCKEAFKNASGIDWRLTLEAFTFDFLEPEAFELELGIASAGCVVFFPEEVNVPLAEINPERAFGSATGQALEAGDCSNTDDFGAREFVLVDCGDPHTIEVFHAFVLDGTEYPGADELADQLEAICDPLFAERYSDADGLVSLFKRPSEATWNEVGDRAAACVAVAPELLS